LVELELCLRVSSRTTRSVAATRPPEAVLDETLRQSRLASKVLRRCLAAGGLFDRARIFSD